MRQPILYVRLRRRVCTDRSVVPLQALAQWHVDGPRSEEIESSIEQLAKKIVPLSTQDQMTVLEMGEVIAHVRTVWQHGEIVPLGAPQTLIVRQKRGRLLQKSGQWLLLLFAWLVLFFGAALTMVHFHTEVAMTEVHARLVTLLLGKSGASNQLVLAIAYACGVGFGMVLFFYRVPWNPSPLHPSPLAVEMHHYEQKVVQYLLEHPDGREP